MATQTILVKTAKQAERLLKAVAATYEFQLPTGEVFTNRANKPEYKGPKTTRGDKPKRHSMQKGYPYGFRLKYIREKMKDLAVGEVAVIEMHDAFDSLEDMRKTVASAAMLAWGKGAHTTLKREDGTAVELLRTN